MPVGAEKKVERGIRFIERASKIHGGLYDYSRVEFDTVMSPVTVVCRTHGPWSVTPDNHVTRKSGCPSCAGNARWTEASMLKFLKHGGRYKRYRVIAFEGVNTTLEIDCAEHGPFRQVFNNHRSGAGCPACASNATTTLETFIERARSVHGSKYDYAKVKYKGTKTKVLIRCPSHGDFWQTPESHCQGGGCQTCAYTHKRVIVNRRVFWIQGYEHFGIRWMLDNTNIPLRDIYEARYPNYRKRPPRIRYVCPHTEKTRIYYPDFWIPSRNIIVEVKSPFTLGSPGSPERMTNDAKKRAVVEAGYRYRRLVFDDKGRKL